MANQAFTAARARLLTTAKVTVPTLQRKASSYVPKGSVSAQAAQADLKASAVRVEPVVDDTEWYTRCAPFYPSPTVEGTGQTGTIAYYGSTSKVGTRHVTREGSAAQGDRRGSATQYSTGPRNEDDMELMFPTRWFSQCQMYVRALLENKPESAEERVYWSLMLMGVIGQGLFAFNGNDSLWGTCRYGATNAKTDQSRLTVDNPTFLGTSVYPPKVPFVVGIQFPQLTELYTLQANVKGVNTKFFSPLPQYWRTALDQECRPKASHDDWDNTVGANHDCRPEHEHYRNQQFNRWFDENPTDGGDQRWWGGRGEDGLQLRAPAAGEHWWINRAFSADAPFLRLPLLGFPHQQATYRLPILEIGGSRETGDAKFTPPKVRQNWWEQYIAAPTAKHMPWCTRGGALFVEEPAFLDQSTDDGRLIVDPRAKAWVEEHTAAHPTGRHAMFRQMWRFFSFACRYDDYNRLYEHQQGRVANPTLVAGGTTKLASEVALEAGATGKIATLPDLVYAAEVAWGVKPPPFRDYHGAGVSAAGSPRGGAEFKLHHKAAWEQGVYDGWANWFINLDFATNVSGLLGVYLNYLAQGYVGAAWGTHVVNWDNTKKLQGALKIHTYMIQFSTPDTVKTMEDQESYRIIKDWISVAVNFGKLIYGVFTQNYKQLVKTCFALYQLGTDLNVVREVPPWLTFARASQGFLRSSDGSAGLYGWACWDVKNGDMETVMERLGLSEADAVAHIAKTKALIQANITPAEQALLLGPEVRAALADVGSPENVARIRDAFTALRANRLQTSAPDPAAPPANSPAIDRAVADALAAERQRKLDEFAQQNSGGDPRRAQALRFAAEPLPSQGGTVVNPPRGKPTPPTVEESAKSALWDTALFAGVLGATGYAVWRFGKKKGRKP